MKCSFDISNFLEEISSLFHSAVFLYFFALIPEEGFLNSSCYSLEICIQMGRSSLFSPCFLLLFFSQLFVRPPETAILLFAFLFHEDGLDPCLLYNVTNLYPYFIYYDLLFLPLMPLLSFFYHLFIGQDCLLNEEWEQQQIPFLLSQVL